MAGSRFLLDTNIIAALLKGDESIADKIDNADEVCIPIIVLGELYYGASYSTHVKRNTKNIQRLTARYAVTPIDDDTSVIYGSIKSSLRKKGRPIPENDVWIAAIAKRYDLILVTRDKHFKEVDGLTVEDW